MSAIRCRFLPLGQCGPRQISESKNRERERDREGCLSESGAAARESKQPSISPSAEAASGRQARAVRPALARVEVHVFSQSVTHLEEAVSQTQPSASSHWSGLERGSAGDDVDVRSV